MLFDRFKQVRAFVFAVDAVCTDGKVWVSERGEQWFALHVRDRYALQLATANYPVAWLGFGNLSGISDGMERLGITDLYISAGDEISVLADWMAGNGLSAADVLGMGSDVANLGVMASTGFCVCPADAAEDVKAVAAYVSPFNGGAGAVRDVIETVMRLQGTWPTGVDVEARLI